jgi:hypothetical protein
MTNAARNDSPITCLAGFECKCFESEDGLEATN